MTPERKFSGPSSMRRNQPLIRSIITSMTTRADFVIRPKLYVRGEPKRGIRSASETRRRIETLDDAVRYVREHRGHNMTERERVIHQLESSHTHEHRLDAIKAFRAWLKAEDLLFPTE